YLRGQPSLASSSPRGGTGGDDSATPSLSPTSLLRLAAARVAAGKAARPQGRRRRGSSLAPLLGDRGSLRRGGGGKPPDSRRFGRIWRGGDGRRWRGWRWRR
ncbi:Os12g0541200, partial [Oryza sativa Japonica Group]